MRKDGGYGNLYLLNAIQLKVTTCTLYNSTLVLYIRIIIMYIFIYPYTSAYQWKSVSKACAKCLVVLTVMLYS